MPRRPRSSLLAAALLAGLLVGLGSGCDVPTAAPSLHTEATLSAPLLAEETYVFMGGGERPALLDTTRTGLDSLLGVGPDASTVYLEQTVQSLGGGTYDDLFDTTGRALTADTTVAVPPAMGTALARQPVRAVVERTNGRFESPGRSVALPLPRAGPPERTVPFPVGRVLDPPVTPVVDARGAGLEGATLAPDADASRITVVLENTQPRGAPLTNGTPGHAPEVAIQRADGPDPLPWTALGTGPVGPGERRTLTTALPGARLDDGTTIALRLENDDATDRLTLDTRTGLQATAVTLSRPEAVDVRVDAAGVPTPAPTASRFAGVVGAEGTIDVQVENGFGVPVALDRLTIANDAAARDRLPADFPALALDLTPGAPIAAGASTTRTATLAGRGVARALDLTLRGTLAPAGPTVTLRAGDGLRTEAAGTARIARMHFWPAGEQVATSGVLSFKTDRVAFPRAGDFVELAGGTIRIDELANELGVGFERLAVSYPGIRRPGGPGAAYAPGDSLQIAFVEQPEGPYEFAAIGPQTTRSQAVSVGALRLLPRTDRISFHLTGTMETVPDTTAEHLRLLRLQDELRATLRVGDLDVQALRGTVRPFAVPVTPDADGDGRVDLADDAEVHTAEWPALRALTRHVDGLQLRGGAVTLTVDTDLGADVQLYGVLQGRHADGGAFLRGRGPARVPAGDPVADAFMRNGTPLGAERLFRADFAGGSSGNTVPRSLTVTEDNASLAAFLQPLPTRIRFAGVSQVQGGRLDVRAPVRLDVGLGVRVPLSFAGDVSVRDTMAVDLSGLEGVADPGASVSVSTARLEVGYENAIPVGVAAAIEVLGDGGTPLLRLPGDGETLTLEAAPKDGDGGAAGTRTGRLSLSMTDEEVRSLARGTRLRLRLRLQQRTGPPARVRADDSLRLSLRADVDASVQAGG
jgi:hypothetical protein